MRAEHGGRRLLGVDFTPLNWLFAIGWRSASDGKQGNDWNRYQIAVDILGKDS